MISPAIWKFCAAFVSAVSDRGVSVKLLPDIRLRDSQSHKDFADDAKISALPIGGQREGTQLVMCQHALLVTRKCREPFAVLG